MKNVIKIIMLAVVSALVLTGVMTETSYAGGCINKNTGQWQEKCTDANAGTEIQSYIQNGINLFIGVIGLLAVAYTIYGGFLFTTSAGDAAKAKQARTTIIYGVLGLVVALLAFAIVNFVVVGIFKGGGAGGDSGSAAGTAESVPAESADKKDDKKKNDKNDKKGKNNKKKDKKDK